MPKLVCPDFKLDRGLTETQLTFFEQNGFIIFRSFVNREKVDLFICEMKRIEKQWLAEGRQKVNGIPIKFGEDENGERMIHRFCFLSNFSQPLHDLLLDPYFNSLTGLLKDEEGRIAENEKDGMVGNHYVRAVNSEFTKMGWHTDSLKDIFYGQRIKPMLNVGIHLDDCPFENGGLRFLPGSHKQGLFNLLFSKKYFIDNKPDRREVGLDIHAGDVTVHDGRIWHRVQQSPCTGEKSRRRVLYIPIITGKQIQKSEQSKTPLYLRLFTTKALRRSF